MAANPHWDLCPETGIGCVMVDRGAGSLKIDLMPDEAARLQELVKAGDLAGAKALLVDVDADAGMLDEAALRALAVEIG